MIFRVHWVKTAMTNLSRGSAAGATNLQLATVWHSKNRRLARHVAMATDCKFSVSDTMITKHGFIFVCAVLIITACSNGASSIVGSKFAGPDCGYEEIEFRNDGNAYFTLPAGAGSTARPREVSGTYKIDGKQVIVSGSTGELEMTWNDNVLSFEIGPKKGKCIPLE